VYRIFHPATAKYTFFSEAFGIFSKIDHIYGHKTSLKKCKKIEITPCIVSDHNVIKLEFNSKSSSRKYTNNWSLNIMSLNDWWVIKEIREEIKKFLKFKENENNQSEPIRHRKGTHKRKVYHHGCIY
jgi:deoxycytidylate deaminase